MAEHDAVRTLVKSGPELWAQCSEPEALSRHLKGFGEVRITRLEPETTVAWEGERARGTVRLEPSGWGTKVTLTAVAPDPLTDAPDPRGGAPPRRAQRVLDWLRRWRPAARITPADAATPVVSAASTAPHAPAVPTAPTDPTAPEPPDPLAPEPPDPLAPEPLDPPRSLAAALDSLGRAHHRPFSRTG